MYDPVTVFLIVLGLFSVGVFLLLCFLTGEFPLAFVVKLVWWCWILLTFACLESSWFFYHIWRRILLGRVLVVGSFPPLLKTYPAIAFWLVEILLRNQLIPWWEIPCMLFVVFPLPFFYILYLSLIFANLITMFLGVFLLGFILPGTLCFLDLVDYFFPHVWEVFSYYLFKYFFRSLSVLLPQLSCCDSF